MDTFLKVLSDEFVKAKLYVMSVDELLPSEISIKLKASFFQFLTDIGAVLQSVFILLFYLVLILLKFLKHYFPGFVAISRDILHWIVDFHRTRLSTSDLIIEGCVVGLAFLYFIFRKKIHATWDRFDKWVRKTSGAAADAAPHVLFFSCALIVSILGQNILVVFASESVLPLVSVVLPLLRTVRVLYWLPERSGQSQYRTILLLWVVLATYHAFATLLTVIPFAKLFVGATTSLLTWLPGTKTILTVPATVFLREFIAVVLIWAQLSTSFAEILFRWTSPLLEYFSSKLPSQDFGQSQLNVMLSALKFARIITDSHAELIRSLLRDGIASLVALLFVFTPVPSIGSVIVALLFPAMKSVSTILPTKWGSAAYEIIAYQTRLRWLEYWVCFGGLWTAHLYGIAVWPIFLMPVSLWLQHSYFQGARVLLQWGTDTYKAMATRNAKMQFERDVRRRQSQAVESRTVYEDTDSATETFTALSSSSSSASISRTATSPSKHLSSSSPSSPIAIAAVVDADEPLVGDSSRTSTRRTAALAGGSGGSGGSKGVDEVATSTPRKIGGANGIRRRAVLSAAGATAAAIAT